MKKESFIAQFAISYNEYLNSSNLTEVPDDMISKWRNDVIYTYENKMDSSIVMSLFDIDDSHKSTITHHNYYIEDNGYYIDNDKKMLVIYMTLKFKK